jgi:hypothetical protein
VVAVEDATWYLIPKEFILELLKIGGLSSNMFFAHF